MLPCASPPQSHSLQFSAIGTNIFIWFSSEIIGLDRGAFTDFFDSKSLTSVINLQNVFYSIIDTFFVQDVRKRPLPGQIVLHIQVLSTHRKKFYSHFCPLTCELRSRALGDLSQWWVLLRFIYFPIFPHSCFVWSGHISLSTNSSIFILCKTHRFLKAFPWLDSTLLGWYGEANMRVLINLWFHCNIFSYKIGLFIGIFWPTLGWESETRTI